MKYFLLLISSFLSLLACNDEAAFEGAGKQQLDPQTQDASGSSAGNGQVADPEKNTPTTPVNDPNKNEAGETAVVPEPPKLLLAEESFVQGEHRSVLMQSDQAASVPLDIIITIDSSRSMTEEQAIVQGLLPLLLPEIGHLDWQIGFNTTDHRGKNRVNATAADKKDDCMHAILKKGDADVEVKFSDAVNVGTNGGTERGLLMSGEGLLAGCQDAQIEGKSWLRQDSALAVIIVSDERNCGYNSNATLGSSERNWYEEVKNNLGTCATIDPTTQGKAHANPSGYLALLESLRPGQLGKKAKVYGFINDGQKQGYSNVIDATLGKSLSLVTNAEDPNSEAYKAVEAQFKVFAKELAKSIRQQVEYNQKLPEEPLDGSLKVFIGDQELTPDQYVYDPVEKSVEISTEIDADVSAIIKVGYQVLMGSIVDKFTLLRKPEPKTMITMMKQKDSTEWFQLSADWFEIQDKTVLFKKAVDEGVEIKMKYKYQAATP